MAVRWLMTVREAGVLSPPLRFGRPRKHGTQRRQKFEALEIWPPSVQFMLSPPYWIAPRDAPAVGDEPPPHPHCFDALRWWPGVVEVRRPDGTRVSAGLLASGGHFNYGPRRGERNADGRVRNPFHLYAVLKGLRVQDVPSGSEIWGDVGNQDVQYIKTSRPEPST